MKKIIKFICLLFLLFGVIFAISYKPIFFIRLKRNNIKTEAKILSFYKGYRNSNNFVYEYSVGKETLKSSFSFPFDGKMYEKYQIFYSEDSVIFKVGDTICIYIDEKKIKNSVPCKYLDEKKTIIDYMLQ